MTALALTVGLFAAAFLMPVPYVRMSPGPTFNTLGKFDGKPMIKIADDTTTYPTSGNLDFTTVSVTRPESRLKLGEALMSWLSSDIAIVPHNLIYSDNQSDADSNQTGAAELSSSKDNSRAAALRAVGFTVPENAKVSDVVAKSPADGVLEAGDVIVAVDGKKVTSMAEVGEFIRARQPGDPVDITYQRGKDTTTVTLKTVAADDDATHPRVGILIATGYDFPITIDNNVGDSIGGPSAGTMFALAIYDQLTPGPLTGGRHFAGTGEISGDGTIGPIGGIHQKIVGARDGGAKFFLVPRSNCAEAIKTPVAGITLFSADTLVSAIRSIEALAANPNAKVPACSVRDMGPLG